MIYDIVNNLPRRGNNAKRLFTTHIILHYDGDDKVTMGEALAKAIAQWTINAKSYAPTIQYHVRIDKEGKIYKCLDLNDLVWHCNNNWMSAQSISVCIDGNNPTAGQISGLAQTVGWLRSIYGNLKIKGHRQVASRYTSCPGDAILNYINNLDKVKGAENMEAPYKAGTVLELNYFERNIRSSANIGSGTVKTLKNKERVTTIGNVVPNVDGYNWIDVNFGEGTGWTIDKYWKVIATPEQAQAKSIKFYLDEAKKNIEEALKLS